MMLQTFIGLLFSVAAWLACAIREDVPTRAGSALLTPRHVAEQCTAREIARHRLVVEGDRELYVEPSVLVSSKRRVLLAGQPTYLFSPQRRAGTPSLEGHGTVFGAVIGRDGRAKTVPLPSTGSRVAAAITSVSTGDGSWTVIFAELDSIPPLGAHPARGFWYGVYDGRRWSSLQRLPAPPGVALTYLNHSELVQKGDSLFWAALVRTATGKEIVTVFERHGTSAWSYQVLQTPFVSYVALSASASGDPVLVLVHPDTTLSSDGNSLFLYERSSATNGWKLGRKIVASSNGDVHRPSLNLSERDDFVLTWKTFVRRGPSVSASFGQPQVDRDHGGPIRTELRAMIGPIPTRNERIVTLDPALAEGWKAVPMSTGPIWVVDHAFDASVGQIPERELRIVRRVGDSIAVLWRTPHPYRGQLSALALSDSEVLIAGPKPEISREVLVSLLIRVNLDCTSAQHPSPESTQPSPH